MPNPARWRIPADIKTLVDTELATARNNNEPRPALERAHLLSQPWAWTHTRVHIAMFRLAIRERDRRELVGQVIRLAVAGPGSLVGKYPPGNTGRTTMGLTETAPIPDDIEAILKPFASRR